MSEPGANGAITAEERGDTSRPRAALARTVTLLATAALVVGIVVAGNLIRGGGEGADAAAPAEAASAGPSASASAAASASASAGASASAAASGSASAAASASDPGSATDAALGALADVRPLEGTAGGTTTIEDTTERLSASAPALVVGSVDAWLTAVSRLAWDDPRAVTAYGTVILSSREQPYGLGDLIERGAVRQDAADTFTLVRSVVVRSGARLQIDAPGATLRMLSTDLGFTEIVGWGGAVALNGAADAPLTVTSWVEATDSPDLDTSDGRGFVLVRNGRFESTHTRYEHLGFWSGRTGGVAVTATDRGLSSAAVSETEHVGLAYGLFLSAVVDTTVTDATISDSRQSGIFVTSESLGVTIDGVTVDGAGRDAIAIERGSSVVSVTDSSVAHAGGFGLRIQGEALAGGPNPSGHPITLAAGFSVQDLTATDNDRGGIGVISGNNVAIDNATVDGSSAALTVDGPVHTLGVTNSTFTASRGIPVVVDGEVTDAKITRSTITGPEVGVSIRDARIALTDNTVTIEQGNAVRVTGDAHVDATGNALIGIGQDAVQVLDGASAVVLSSDMSGWDFRPEFVQWLNQHPLAWLWLFVLVIPAAGVPFILVRRRKHRELRRLLEDAIIRYGRGRIAAYAGAGGDAAGAEDSSGAGVGRSGPDEAAWAVVSAAEGTPAGAAPEAGGAEDRAARFLAELGSSRNPAPPVTRPIPRPAEAPPAAPPAQTGYVRTTDTAPSPVFAPPSISPRTGVPGPVAFAPEGRPASADAAPPAPAGSRTASGPHTDSRTAPPAPTGSRPAPVPRTTGPAPEPRTAPVPRSGSVPHPHTGPVPDPRTGPVPHPPTGTVPPPARQQAPASASAARPAPASRSIRQPAPAPGSGVGAAPAPGAILGAAAGRAPQTVPVSGPRRGPSQDPRISAPATAGSAAASARAPRSLRDLREMLSSREFASMQDFAVAAVLEAQLPLPVIARLFRVPSWRLEQWLQEAVAELERPTPPPARRGVPVRQHPRGRI